MGEIEEISVTFPKKKGISHQDGGVLQGNPGITTGETWLPDGTPVETVIGTPSALNDYFRSRQEKQRKKGFFPTLRRNLGKLLRRH